MARNNLLNLEGFDDLIKQIEAAGGESSRIAKAAAESGAQAYKEALTAECNRAGVPGDVTQEIKKKVTSNAERSTARVGWEMGAYNPENPSAGYKAVFLNYGTPKRTTKSGANRGQIVEKGFISKAKKKAKKQIKKSQQKALETILKRLKNER